MSLKELTINRINVSRSLVVLGLVGLMSAVAPAASLAATATQNGYDEAAPLSEVNEAATTSAATESVSSLPFTGLELAVLAFVAIALVGVGLLIRRANRVGDLGS